MPNLNQLLVAEGVDSLDVYLDALTVLGFSRHVDPQGNPPPRDNTQAWQVLGDALEHQAQRHRAILEGLEMSFSGHGKEMITNKITTCAQWCEQTAHAAHTISEQLTTAYRAFDQLSVAVVKPEVVESNRNQLTLARNATAAALNAPQIEALETEYQ